MKRVLITGVSGFTGSFLAEYLLSLSSYEVIGTYHSTQPTAFHESSISLEKIDLNAKDQVEELIKQTSPDVIFHLAALTSPAESFDDPARTITNNVVGQVNLLEAVKNNKLLDTKIFIVSSADVYGIVRESDIPIDEETPFRPGNPYAVSKITQDYLGLQYFLSYKLQTIRIRPFNHIGPRQSDKFAISSFAKQIAEIEKKKKDPVIKVGNLDAKKDFTDVRDITRAYAMLIEKGEPGGVYNIGSGNAYRVGDLLQKLVSLSTTQIAIEQDQARMRPSETPLLVCNNRKFVSLTGWKPDISIDTTLKSILDYWRSVI